MENKPGLVNRYPERRMGGQTEPLQDCQFLQQDRGYPRRMMRMIWVSLSIHLFVFAFGSLIAPFVRSMPPAILPPLIKGEISPDQLAERNRPQSFQSTPYGPPPALGRTQPSAVLREGERTIYSVRRSVIQRQWSPDERMNWLEQRIFVLLGRGAFGLVIAAYTLSRL